jgi:beta-glucosidase/6-phospho-beta-glucosidase/beta-galactosidase
MELLDKIIDAIEANVDLNALIKVGILINEPSAVCVRLIPSNSRIAYMDNGRVYQMSFQVLVKDPNEQEAIRVLDEITYFIDRLTHDDITLTDSRFQFIQCNVYTMPNFVEKTEHDEYIYTALFNAEYEKKGE